MAPVFVDYTQEYTGVMAPPCVKARQLPQITDLFIALSIVKTRVSHRSYHLENRMISLDYLLT